MQRPVLHHEARARPGDVELHLIVQAFARRQRATNDGGAAHLIGMDDDRIPGCEKRDMLGTNIDALVTAVGLRPEVAPPPGLLHHGEKRRPI